MPNWSEQATVWRKQYYLYLPCGDRCHALGYGLSRSSRRKLIWFIVQCSQSRVRRPQESRTGSSVENVVSETIKVSGLLIYACMKSFSLNMFEMGTKVQVYLLLVSVKINRCDFLFFIINWQILASILNPKNYYFWKKNKTGRYIYGGSYLWCHLLTYWFYNTKFIDQN